MREKSPEWAAHLYQKYFIKCIFFKPQRAQRFSLRTQRDFNLYVHLLCYGRLGRLG
jgi:hypothetical protein